VGTTHHGTPKYDSVGKVPDVLPSLLAQGEGPGTATRLLAKATHTRLSAWVRNPAACDGLFFCQARGWQVAKIVKECGSGVNDQRPLLLGLLADTSISHLVVEHKDRCSRCGVAYIQTLLATQGRELVIVHEAGKEQNDLLQDFVAIITSFTTRLYGRRQASRKRSHLLAALELETG